MRKLLFFIPVVMAMLALNQLFPDLSAQTQTASAVRISIVRLDPRFDELVPKDAELEKLAI